MKDLIIIGAGGMGRSFYDIAVGSIGYLSEFRIKGFLDDNIYQLDSYEGYPPILGTISDYTPAENDIFICSIGDVETKKKCSVNMIDKGGVFVTLISKMANISKNSKIGKGSVIAPYAILGTDCLIGDNSLIQSFAVIGHDARIGCWTRIDTHVTCVGGVIIGDEVTLHTGAIINHKVVVEKGACVGAGSFVVKRVKTGTTVYGNPAVKL